MQARRPRAWPDRLPHLALYPERLICRASHVREGRTLHLLDLENLCGGPDRIRSCKRAVVDLYRTSAGIAQDDHVVIGTNPGSLIDCFDILLGSQLVGRSGPDGADQALLDVVRDIDWVARRFDRVVFGSGDHCFAPSAAALRARGILVGVVARAGSVSRCLKTRAAFVQVFRLAEPLEAVAS